MIRISGPVQSHHFFVGAAAAVRSDLISMAATRPMESYRNLYNARCYSQLPMSRDDSLEKAGTALVARLCEC